MNSFSKRPRLAKALFSYSALELQLAQVKNAEEVLIYDPKNQTAKDLLKKLAKK